jgi:hypothetical protein
MISTLGHKIARSISRQRDSVDPIPEDIAIGMYLLQCFWTETSKMRYLPFMSLQTPLEAVNRPWLAIDSVQCPTYRIPFAFRHRCDGTRDHVYKLHSFARFHITNLLIETKS